MPGPDVPDLSGYEVLDELGRGGMGRVLRARHRKTGAVRALKVIAGFVDPDALERLRREGEALARVGGDAVVPVHEAGIEKGRAFLVLGLMPGGSLRERLRAERQLDWREASALVATIARALERCHSVGLVHRDLKPDNVLFDDTGRPRLADFGCVRDLGAKTLTSTGETLGTLPYMAPEQLDATRATPKVDVYALGVMLFELIAGHLPFDASGGPALLLREKLSPSRPRPLLPGAPAALDALVDRAMAVDPADRPDAASLANELDAILAGSGHCARPSRRPSALVAGLGAAVVAVVAVAALVVAWWAAASPSAPAPTGPTPGPRRVTPPRPAPAAQPKTVKDAIVTLQTTRPAKEAAELVAALFAAPDPPSELERAALRTAALDRVAREGRDHGELAPAAVLRAACGDALHALAIALTAGSVDRKDADPIQKLVKLIKQLNGARAYELIDDDLLRLLVDVVPRLRDVEVARASGDLCETADRAPLHADPDLLQAAVEAAIAVGDNSDLRFVRGKLLAHRTLREGRRDLIATALSDLASARDLRDPGTSKSQAILSVAIAARLHAVDDRHLEGLALLDEPLDPVLQKLLEQESSGATRALLALERGRIELQLGQGRRAADALLSAANAVRANHRELAKKVEEHAGRARTMTDRAEFQALARSLPELF